MRPLPLGGPPLLQPIDSGLYLHALSRSGSPQHGGKLTDLSPLSVR